MLGFYNLHYSSARVQNWGFCFCILPRVWKTLEPSSAGGARQPMLGKPQGAAVPADAQGGPLILLS